MLRLRADVRIQHRRLSVPITAFELNANQLGEIQQRTCRAPISMKIQALQRFYENENLCVSAK